MGACCCCMKAGDVETSAPVNSPNDLCQYDEAKEPFVTTDGTSAGKIVYAKSGAAAESGHSAIVATTLPKLFAKACAQRGDQTCLRVERPCPEINADGTWPAALPADQWQTHTYQQYYDDCQLAAKGFISLGVEQHDSVAVFGFNSPEWFIGAMGAIFCGAKCAGIYPTDTPEQVQFKAHHAGASVAVVEDERKLKVFMSVIDQLPKLKSIVVWSYAPNPGEELTRTDGTTVSLLGWKALLELGKKGDEKQLLKRIEDQEPSHCCAIVYTSGTTGEPKGVMVSHDNIIFTGATIIRLQPSIGATHAAERIISYLPLSHVAGFMLDVICPIAIGAFTNGWCEVGFARPYDLKVGALGDRLRAVEPTILLGVPRVWEKIAEKMRAVGAVTTGAKRKIATWAKAKSLAHQENCQLGGSGAYPCCYGMADKIVLSKIKAALGLTHCKVALTGAAPIARETLAYFGSIGIQINEVYGMSECCGVATWSTSKAHVWGSCGFALLGVEVKILKEDGKECPPASDIFNATEEQQGEICYRGRNIMKGYLANPDLGKEHVELITKKSKEAIDSNGWCHSGDKGCMGDNGMLRITGRYKELIITAGGENIAPVPIEDNIKNACPALSNVMMVGDQRKFNICLVTLKAAGATGENPGGDELTGPALQVNSATTTISGAHTDPAFAGVIENAIKEVNKTAPNNASKIQRFTILPAGDFSVETGELTPTLKLKRGVVAKMHANMIDRIYAAERGNAYVPFVEDTVQEEAKVEI